MAKKVPIDYDPAPLELLGEGLSEYYLDPTPETVVPSGLPSLDKIILGAVAGEVLLIAGPPGQGKTSLAMQWATMNAQNGMKTAVLSMEMGKTALGNRLVSGLTGIPLEVLRMKTWKTKEQLDLAKQASDYLKSIPLHIDVRSGLDAKRIYETITGWKDKSVGLGIIDYLQMMSGINESRVTQIGDAIRAIKAGAKDAHLPVIVLSSINRNAALLDRPPRLSDLRDSGDIEFVGDTILMFKFNDEDYNDNIRACDIHVMKQRNGPTGIASVNFNKPATRFEER